VMYNIQFVCTLYNVHVRDKYLSHAKLKKNVNLSKFKCSLTYTRTGDNGEKCLQCMNIEPPPPPMLTQPQWPPSYPHVSWSFFSLCYQTKSFPSCLTGKLGMSQLQQKVCVLGFHSIFYSTNRDCGSALVLMRIRLQLIISMRIRIQLIQCGSGSREPT
jgi:hypothetical protein